MPEAYNNMYKGCPWEKNDAKLRKVSFSEILKLEKVIGKSSKADAKIAGITPAELIFSGKWEESPP